MEVSVMIKKIILPTDYAHPQYFIQGIIMDEYMITRRDPHGASRMYLVHNHA